MPNTIFFLAILIVALVLVGVIYLFKVAVKPRKLHEIEEEIRKGNNSTAIRSLRSWLDKNPEDYNAHRLLGKAYFKDSNLQLATVEYRLAEKGIDNEDNAFEIDVRSTLGQIYQQSGDNKAALEELLLLSKIDDKNKNTFFQIGKIYQSLNLHDRASKYFRQCTQLDTQFAKAFFELGISLYESGNLKDSLMEFTHNITLDKKNYASYFHVGMIYKNMQELGKALENLEIAEKDKTIQPKAILNKGLCHIQLGNIPKAVEELSRGIKIYNKKDNTLWNMRYYLAQASEMKKDILNAIEQWEKIHLECPNFKDVYAKLSQYDDLRKSDYLKDYICAPLASFQKICANIVASMGYTVHETTVIDNETLRVIARESTKMVATKALLKMVIFTRNNEPVTEKHLSNSLDEMKKANCTLVIYTTTHHFNNSAKSFAMTRPIDLIDPKALTELIKKSELGEGEAAPQA